MGRDARPAGGRRARTAILLAVLLAAGVASAVARDAGGQAAASATSGPMPVPTVPVPAPPRVVQVDRDGVEVPLPADPPSEEATLAVRLQNETGAPEVEFTVQWRGAAGSPWSHPLRLSGPLHRVLRFGVGRPQALRFALDIPGITPPWAPLAVQTWWELPGAVPRPEVQDAVWQLFTFRRPAAWQPMASPGGGMAFAGGYDLTLTVTPLDWPYLERYLGHEPPYPLDEVAAWWMGRTGEEVLAREDVRVDGFPALRLEYLPQGWPRSDRHAVYLVALPERVVALDFAGGSDPALWQAAAEILSTVRFPRPLPPLVRDRETTPARVTPGNPSRRVVHPLP